MVQELFDKAFTSLEEEQIVEGVKRLKAALDAYRNSQ